MPKEIPNGVAKGQDTAKLQSGDQDFRAYVGPPDQYDVLGATQFSLLYAVGLRSRHRLLDIGCGSLRAGRLLIPYLGPERYTGLEPNKWLIDEAIEKQIGHDVLAIKKPTFVYNDQFDLSGLERFDFIVAQSVASHTGPEMTKKLLRSISDGLRPTGVSAVTFMHTRRADNAREGWFYPECVRYRRKTLEGWIRDAGLKGTAIAWFHPRQTWWLLAHRDAPLPPRLFRWLARGETLSMKRSWNPLETIVGPNSRPRASIKQILHRG